MKCSQPTQYSCCHGHEQHWKHSVHSYELPMTGVHSGSKKVPFPRERRLEYDRTKGFSSSAGAELFKTHVRLAKAKHLQLKFGYKEPDFCAELNSSAGAEHFQKYHRTVWLERSVQFEPNLSKSKIWLTQLSPSFSNTRL